MTSKGELILCRYLSGNYAPVTIELPLTPCDVTGKIPKELSGGQYVRNGGNPLVNDTHPRDAHWFDVRSNSPIFFNLIL